MDEGPNRHFFSPEFYRSQIPFTIEPRERILIFCDEQDLVYSFRACCDRIMHHSNDQLCHVVRNTSLNTTISVHEGTYLHQLLSMSWIRSRLACVPINEIPSFHPYQTFQIPPESFSSDEEDDEDDDDDDEEEEVEEEEEEEEEEAAQKSDEEEKGVQFMILKTV